MKALFSIGHFSIYIFGVFIALGMIAGYFIAIKEGRRKGFNEDKLMNMILLAIIGGVIGARAYYVIAFNLEYYLSNPSQIIAFRDGGLSIQGALIGGILFTLVYARIKKINILEVADIMAPGIILGQAIGRVGCDVFGIEMSKNYFWGVTINGQLLHPAQIYEAVLNFILFGFLWSRRKSTKYNGELFILYLIGFSINRFIVEFFRTNPIAFGSLTIAHVTSIVIIALTLITGFIIKKNSSVIKSSEGSLVNISLMEIAIILLAIAAFVVTYYFIWI